MRIKCEYCGQLIEASLPSCSYCGGVNVHMQRLTPNTPKTIAQLKEYCSSHNISPEDMRFFISQDYPGPHAFGIYQDGADFIVYENDSACRRTILYAGTDQAYAVYEVFFKLREQTLNAKEYDIYKKERLKKILAKEDNKPLDDAEEDALADTILSSINDKETALNYKLISAAVGLILAIIFSILGKI